MPLKEGSLPTDKEVDISSSSLVDRPTCNKLLCKLGYSRDDDIRYPKIIQQVFGRLRTEENGDGNAAQRRHLYKKLSHCKDNYPDVVDIPNKIMCDRYNNTNTSSSPSYTSPPPQSNYNPPPPHQKSSKPEKPTPSDDQLNVAKDEFKQVYSFINGSFHDQITALTIELYKLDRLATTINDLIWKTNDNALKKSMNGVRVDLIGIRGHLYKVSSDQNYMNFKKLCSDSDISFDKFIKQYETKQHKNSPKPPKAPKTAKAPKPPKAPKAPKAPKTAKVPKTAKSRKGPKTAKAPTPPPRTPTPPPRTPTPPRANSTRKRCPNGTRRNKKTGNCDPK